MPIRQPQPWNLEAWEPCSCGTSDPWNLRAISCVVWGHSVDNHQLGTERNDHHHCRCGARYLARDGSLTRVRHTLSCFLGKHEYTKLVERDGCREYVCVQCGHPLVYRTDVDPYRATRGFKKKVRYLCGLFGHEVEVVSTRNGWVEHACHCGHSFLRPEKHDGKIHHPLVCVLSGHYVRFVTSRAGYDEFICVNCGHPFCFAGAERPRSANASLASGSARG